MRRALLDRHTAEGPEAVLMVVGAGRGPLVSASLAAAKAAGRRVRVYALDKNENAVITLQNRCLSEPEWAESVTVVSSDMRDWAAPVQADMLISELLGSWGDNELSPECLDGAQRCGTHPGGARAPFPGMCCPPPTHPPACVPTGPTRPPRPPTPPQVPQAGRDLDPV